MPKTTAGGKKTTARPKGRKRNKAELVSQVLDKVVTNLNEEKNVKASVSDLIRLLQLEDEMSEETVREIEVKWVDTNSPEGGTEA